MRTPRLRSTRIALRFGVAATLAASLVACGTSDPSSQSAEQAAESAVLPSDQADFLKSIAEAHEIAGSGNDIAIEQAKKDRGAAICAALAKDLTVVDWVGSVEEVGKTMLSDEGTLSVRIADDITVATWNNGVSDVGDKTLIAQDSPLWEKLINLSDDDKVVFSGKFVADDEECVRESSLTNKSALTRPNFILAFTEVSLQD